MIQLLATQIDERTQPAELERVRRNLIDAVRELQQGPSAGTRIIKDVALANSTLVLVPHNLGRPAFVTVSPPRDAATVGMVIEVRDGTYDRSKYVGLYATGYGATVTVDVEVK